MRSTWAEGYKEVLFQRLHRKEAASKRLQWKGMGQEDASLVAVSLECSCLPIFSSFMTEGNSMEIMSV